MLSINRATRALPVLLAIALSGCSDFLDVNNNPNAPESAPIDIRLPGLEATFIHSAYSGSVALWGSEWTQQWAFNGTRRSYSQVQNYELFDTDAASTWDYLYSRPGNAAFTMARDASAEADTYYRGIAKLFSAWTFQLITDLWGPAPYGEAFKPEIREPKYESQQTIYNGVFANLDSAVTLLSSTSSIARRPTATNDLLYAGDVAKWNKLAHFLQARANLRLAYAPGEDKVGRANKALAALAGAFASNADDADFIYPGGANARNPNYTFQELRNTFVGSQYMIQMLQDRQDPRLSIMFTAIVYDSIRGTGTSRKTYPAKPNTFLGHVPGSDQSQADSTVSMIGPFFSNENANLSVASYADQKFTEAEARLIASGASAADAPYRDGIRANMTKLGVPTAAINAYLATRPALTSANALQEIIAEKYVANFLKTEPWNDWRRTGYPVVPLVPQAVIPTIPQRIRAPNSELSANSVQVTASGFPTGQDGMKVKLWWAGGDNK